MEILPKVASRKGSADIFVGDVWLDQIASGEAPSRVQLGSLRTGRA